MLRFRRFFVSVLIVAIVARFAVAADSNPFLPAISIQIVTPSDPAAYAACVADINAAMKAKHGVPLFLRAYAGVATGESVATFFALSPGDSFGTVQKNAEAFANDVALGELRTRMQSLAASGSPTLLKAVRFDGTHAPGSLFNTQAVVSDEPAFLAAIAKLRVSLDAHEMANVRINVFRVIAGRTTYSHLISFNAPSAARLAAVLDVLATAPWAAEWNAEAARLHTVVRNGTFREITD